MFHIKELLHSPQTALEERHRPRRDLQAVVYVLPEYFHQNQHGGLLQHLEVSNHQEKQKKQ